MATLYTDRSATQLPAAGADTWSREPGIEATGNVLYMEAIYTLTSGTDEASGDVIRIAKLPANARLLPELCKIVRNDPGSAFNIATIGDEPVVSGAFTGDADRYSTAIDISAAGTSDFAYAAQPAGLAGYTLPADAWITATLGTITSPTAGQVIKFLLAYVAAV
jgi:hypothetical protein